MDFLRTFKLALFCESVGGRITWWRCARADDERQCSESGGREGLQSLPFIELQPPAHSSPTLWPFGQLVGPPCSCHVPASNGPVADFTIFTARVLEWAGKDRHSVDGPAAGTGIFTAIAGSHAGFGVLLWHGAGIAASPSRRHGLLREITIGWTTTQFRPW